MVLKCRARVRVCDHRSFIPVLSGFLSLICRNKALRWTLQCVRKCCWRALGGPRHQHIAVWQFHAQVVQSFRPRDSRSVAVPSDSRRLAAVRRRLIATRWLRQTHVAYMCVAKRVGGIYYTQLRASVHRARTRQRQARARAQFTTMAAGRRLIIDVCVRRCGARVGSAYTRRALLIGERGARRVNTIWTILVLSWIIIIMIIIITADAATQPYTH